MSHLILSQSEVNGYGKEIAKVLNDIPLFYIVEVLELGLEERKREGDLEGLDNISESDNDSTSESDNESVLSVCSSPESSEED